MNTHAHSLETALVKPLLSFFGLRPCLRSGLGCQFSLLGLFVPQFPPFGPFCLDES